MGQRPLGGAGSGQGKANQPGDSRSSPTGRGASSKAGDTGTAGCICRYLACVCRNLCPDYGPQGHQALLPCLPKRGREGRAASTFGMETSLQLPLQCPEGYSLRVGSETLCSDPSPPHRRCEIRGLRHLLLTLLPPGGSGPPFVLLLSLRGSLLAPGASAALPSLRQVFPLLCPQVQI